MKKRYTGSDEPKKIWNTICKHEKKRGGIYLPISFGGKEFVFYSYEKLISDSRAAALLLLEMTSPYDPITIAADAYDTMMILLACSLISRSVIISDERDSMTFRGLIITDKKSYSPKFISPEELHTLIAGTLSGNPSSDIQCTREEIEITFRSKGENVTYSESSALLSAIAFKTGCALSSHDRLISLFSPSLENGFLCGILSPLISGASLAVCSQPESIIRQIKALSPTKLFCERKVASALILKLLKIKKLHPRSPKAKISLSIDPSVIWLNRLTHPRISYLLGGKLKTVISLGELSPISAKAFFSFGIYSISIRSVKGITPTLFHYGEDKKGKWKLPVGASADICNVQTGGLGNIVISSPYVREGHHTPNTYLPYEKASPSSLVTPLCGFVAKKGGVFILGE